MAKYKLGEIFEIGSGGTPSKAHPEYYGGEIPWIKTGDLKAEYLYEAEDYITEIGLKNSSAKMYNPGTVLIAMYGATIGATSILKFSACTNQACAAFKKNDLILPEFLYYFLKSQKAKFVKDGVGGAQPNISTSYLKQVEIDLCSVDAQKKIVDVLDATNRVINTNQEQLAKLDELIKARFVEMFGDLVFGNKIKTNMHKIGEIASVTKLAGFEFTKYIKYKEHGDIIMLRGLNCKNGKLVLDDIKWIDKDTSNLLPRSKLFYGDILMTYAGTIGDVAMVDADDKYHLAPNVAKITLNDKDDYNPVFLMHLFMYSNDYIMTFASQVAQASINMEKIRNFEYYFPCVDMQNAFAAFVKQVDKSRLAVQKSLEKTQLLFDSLMQEYFG